MNALAGNLAVLDPPTPTGITYTLSQQEQGGQDQEAVSVVRRTLVNIVTPRFYYTGTGESIRTATTAAWYRLFTLPQCEAQTSLTGCKDWTQPIVRFTYVAESYDISKSWIPYLNFAPRVLDCLVDLSVVVRHFPRAEIAYQDVVLLASPESPVCAVVELKSSAGRFTGRRRRMRQNHASISAEAKQIKALSGLTYPQLGELFDVTKQSYHAWIKGASPSGKHRAQILAVLALLQEAGKRLEDVGRMCNWLVSPISPGSPKRPIDFLRVGRYTAFRGLLLQIPTRESRTRSVTSLPRTYSERPRDDYKARLNELRPPAWAEDDDDDER